MAAIQSFSPGWGTGVSVTTGASSAVTALAGKDSTSLCVTNLGDAVLYFRTGGSNAVATTADYPVLGGQQVSVTINRDHTHIAYIAPSGTPAMHAMRGEGF